jgi:MYXO-CTERM domain-containing protein
MNSITIKDGDAQYEKWLYFVAWRYNGCMGCTTQINKYRTGTNKLRDEFGPGFWTITPPEIACELIPAAGREIDETDGCFHKAGTATSWYEGDAGMGGACLITYTTDDTEADNHATWQLRFEAAGRYRVEVYTGALAQSHQAKYVVTHAGGKTDVVIDQAAAQGYRVLGDFEFAADGAVDLGDNTGEHYDPNAKVAIVFDAIRIVPADMPPGDDVVTDDPSGDGSAGGCRAGQTPGVFMLALLGVATRKRRRRSA